MHCTGSFKRAHCQCSSAHHIADWSAHDDATASGMNCSCMPYKADPYTKEQSWPSQQAAASDPEDAERISNDPDLHLSTDKSSWLFRLLSLLIGGPSWTYKTPWADPFLRGLPSFAGCLMNPLCEDCGVPFGFHISSSHSGTDPFKIIDPLKGFSSKHYLMRAVGYSGTLQALRPGMATSH